jgi:hypothetical protein
MNVVRLSSAPTPLFTVLVLVAMSFSAMHLTSNRALAQDSSAWPQWGPNPQHTSFLCAAPNGRVENLLLSL